MPGPFCFASCRHRAISPGVARAFALCVLAGSLLLSACWNPSEPPAALLAETYVEKPGDSFSWSTTLQSAVAGGSPATTVSTLTLDYAQADAIPSKYAYSGRIAGPYLVAQRSLDASPLGAVYMDANAGTIIDDDLSYYISSDYLSYQGVARPRNASLGDNYHYGETATLFDSLTGNEVGQRKTELHLHVLDGDSLTVPAGNYNALRIAMETTIVTQINGDTVTETATGYLWLEQDQGVLLRRTIDNGRVVYASDGSVVSYQSDTVLQDYHRNSGAAAATALSQNPPATAGAPPAGLWRHLRALSGLAPPRLAPPGGG